MDVFDAVEKRRSIRKYLPKEIPKEQLMKLLESARLAPSGSNIQPWELIVVTDPETKRALVSACKDQDFVGECSAVVAGLDNPKAKWHKVDVTIALEHIALTAMDLDLGTCWIGAFYSEQVKEILGIPEEKNLVALLTVGYPAESPPATSRKPLEKLVHWEKYGSTT